MRRASTALLFLCIAFSANIPLDAQTGPVEAVLKEWQLPREGSGPAFLAPDGEGGFWFTQQDSARLGHFDPASGILREWQDPSPFLNFGITTDAQGFVWFAIWSRALMRFDPESQRFESFDIPTNFPIPFMVHVDGEVCTGQFERRVVACLDPTARVWTEWPLPPALDEPEGLVATESGQLWIGLNSGHIARLDRLTGELTVWSLPQGPQGAEFRLQLTADSLGGIWFPLIDHGEVCRLDPFTSELTTYSLANPDARPFGVAVDSLGQVWTTEIGTLGNAIARSTPWVQENTTAILASEVQILEARHAPSRVLDWGVETAILTQLPETTSRVTSSSPQPGLEEWSLPTSGAAPSSIASINPGQIVFLEFGADRIAELQLTPGSSALGIADALVRVAQLTEENEVTGTPGLLRKIEQIAEKAVDSTFDFASGRISRQRYLQELQGAQTLLDALRNQMAAKIRNGEVPPLDAVEILALLEGVCEALELLSSSA